MSFFKKDNITLAICTILMSTLNTTYAALALDRTRAIMVEADKSISLYVTNENIELPYLAQAWIENEEGEKIKEPLTVIPPIQRIEPGKKTQVKIQKLNSIKSLPDDRESIFYFNLREIPPRSDKPNTLQLALQTRIKLFYRPKSITPTREQMENPWQEQLTLTRQTSKVIVNNPTPYFITLVDATAKKDGESIANFEPIMVPPLSDMELKGDASQLGDKPVLTYINDYGGRPLLTFKCESSKCIVTPEKK